MKTTYQSLILILILSLISCTGTSSLKRNLANEADGTNVQELPSILKEAQVADQPLLTIEVLKKMRKIDKTLSSQQAAMVSRRITDYFSFLGFNSYDFFKAEDKDKEETVDPKLAKDKLNAKEKAEIAEGPEKVDEDEDKAPSHLKVLQRFFQASNQFLFCPDFLDWECLEKDPILTPDAEFRKPKQKNLGEPVAAGEFLDLDVYFTKAWSGRPNSEMVEELASKIKTDGSKNVSMAMYGIDDINGTMKPLFDELSEIRRKVELRAVIDVAGFEKGPEPWVFDYLNPHRKNINGIPLWIFDAPPSSASTMNTTFQYDGTPDFIRMMNKSIKKFTDAKVRIEWPTSHIMHNKFAVLESQDGRKSVWTGTANFSKNCMGAEANSNMSVYIKNDFIAQAYLEQFNMMFNFDDEESKKMKTKLVVPSHISNTISIGRFHRNKYPASRRLFQFADGTKVRVFFAPTDDAEHRAILPMLLSAKAGDEIRISMFGGTGYEIVRAMQFALAKGANIWLLLDRQLGHSQTSWIKDKSLNLWMKNPYLEKVIRPAGVKVGTLKIKSSNWDGKNHYKVGSLCRKQASGPCIAEQIILGSQNWSSGGNDYNDENLLAIMNIKDGVSAAKLFNQEFDDYLWPASRNEKKGQSQ